MENDLTKNSFESSLYWCPVDNENKNNKKKRNGYSTSKVNSNISSKLESNINIIEKTIFNIKRNSDKIVPPGLAIPNHHHSKVVYEDFDNVPEEILEDIKNYNEIRFEEYQHKMTERKTMQKGNKRISSPYRIQKSDHSHHHDPSEKMISMSPYIITDNKNIIEDTSCIVGNCNTTININRMNHPDENSVDYSVDIKYFTNKKIPDREEINQTNTISNENMEKMKCIVSINNELDESKRFENNKNLDEITPSKHIENMNENLNEEVISTKEPTKNQEIHPKKEISINGNEVDQKDEILFKEIVSEEPKDADTEDSLKESPSNEIKLIENYAEQDYHKEVDNFQSWLQKKNENEHKKKSAKNKKGGLNTPKGNNHKLMSDYKNNIHNEPIINKKEMTKERKEKNDKAYNDWLNEKLSKEKEKKIQDKNKKMEQLEKEKKDIEMKNKMDQRRNEKLDEWFNTKKEQEKNKKKLEEKHKKEEELKKEKQKQMENDNFKAWCQKKDQEKRNLKGKNLEVKFHVAEHTEAWVDPNAPPKENPPIVRDASQTTSLQSSRLCLYKSKSKIRNKGKGLLSATSMSDYNPLPLFLILLLLLYKHNLLLCKDVV